MESFNPDVFVNVNKRCQYIRDEEHRVDVAPHIERVFKEQLCHFKSYEKVDIRIPCRIDRFKIATCSEIEGYLTLHFFPTNNGKDFEYYIKETIKIHPCQNIKCGTPIFMGDQASSIIRESNATSSFMYNNAGRFIPPNGDRIMYPDFQGPRVDKRPIFNGYHDCGHDGGVIVGMQPVRQSNKRSKRI